MDFHGAFSLINEK